MPVDSSHPFRHRLAACGRTLSAAYRHANTLSYHLLGLVCKLLLLAYFIFCALFLTLRYVVLPHIDDYKGAIERIASRAIGNPVTIATIGASWDGLRPRLSLGDVVIHDAAGASALVLPQVAASISWQTVLVGDLRLHNLAISRPDLSILRDAQGRIFIAGIHVNADRQDNGAVAWVLAQPEIVIRDGRLRWEDRLRGAPEVTLDGLHLVLRNHWLSHRFSMRATPPAALAAPLDVRADFRHAVFARDIADIRHWSGVLYADLHAADLAAWRPYFDLPVAIDRGTGAIRAWLTLDQSRVADFTADLKLDNLSAQLGPGLAPLQLTRVAGRIGGTEPLGAIAAGGLPQFGANGHSVSLQDFSLTMPDGTALPPTTISETFIPATGRNPEKFSISAQLLDLQILGDLAGRLPLTGAQRQLLADLSPRGRLSDFSAQWQGTYPEVQSYSVKGSFGGLGLHAQPPRLARAKSGSKPAQAAVPGIPGFDNLTGRAELTDRGGSLTLASQQPVFQLPGYFADSALPFDRLDMQAQWRFEAGNVLALNIANLDFSRPGLAGSISGTHLWPLQGDGPGVADLTATLSKFDVATIGRYLPLQTPATLRDWLTGALLRGNLTDTVVRLKGDLAHFPFQTTAIGTHAAALAGTADAGKGQFILRAKFDDLTMNYSPQHVGPNGKSPEWPLLEQGKGTLTFDHAGLAIHADTARSAGVGLSDVTALIADPYTENALLDINGTAAGSMQNLVGYVNVSHVAEWIDHFTEETVASGDGRLQLRLLLPLHHVIDAKVTGTLQFQNNDVRLQEAIPMIYRASGKLGFNETGFSLSDLKGQFLGEPVVVGGGTQADKSTLVSIDGGASVDGLRRAFPAPEVQRLLDKASGSARFRAAISVRNHLSRMTVESNLQGFGVSLPAPLGKAASETLPLKYEMIGLPGETGASGGGSAAAPAAMLQRDEIRVGLGNLIDAHYLREKPADRHAQARVVSAGIGINQPAVLPQNGLLMSISAPAINLDDWGNFINDVSAATVATTDGSDGAGASAHTGIAEYVQPDMFAARAESVTVMGRKLERVVMGATHTGNVWQLNLDSAQASGYATWSQSRSGRTMGKITARLSRLNIPESASDSVGDLLSRDETATEIPALDIVAEDFHLRGKPLGRLELLADNVRANTGAGREWRIAKLSLRNPDAELKASGNWTANGKDNLSHLTYALDVHDAGKLLSRFGFDGMVRGGHGVLDGDVTWAGLPFAIDIPTLSGQIHLDLEAGQFLKVDPGAAKLLGVLNLQALPRRLTLDFRDVFSQGFSFDRAFGTAAIAKGIASTDNLKMTSVAATVLMSGEADINKETQQLHVVVIPEFNLGTASLVALAINPVVGAGTFLAQLFLRNPLMRQLTFEYQVSGPWTDPVVTKLEHAKDN